MIQFSTTEKNRLPILNSLGPGPKILNILKRQKKTATDKSSSKERKKPNK